MSLRNVIKDQVPGLSCILLENEACRNAVNALLNCQFENATGQLSSSKDENAIAMSIHCLSVVLQYLTSFEEQHKTAAIQAINHAESMFTSESNHFRKKIKSTAQGTAEGKALFIAAANHQLDILTADCFLYSAIITVMNMDISSYIKASWMVRKAWKLYEAVYGNVKVLYAQHFPERCAELGIATSCDSSPRSISSSSNSSYATPNSSPSHSQGSKKSQRLDSLKSKFKPNKKSQVANTTMLSASNNNVYKDSDVEQQLVDGLMASVCFGYGVFHLCCSILSPQVLRIVQFLGFPSDRALGLRCLKFCSKSNDCKSSFATLTLLWYHTIARPFFALDGAMSLSAIKEANVLLKGKGSQIESSVLFLFFRGRVERLQADLTTALSTFTKALQLAGQQRELRLMCQYERGWCYMLLMKYPDAVEAFTEMKQHSKWSPAYYVYLCGLCHGANDDITTAIADITEAHGLVKRKHNPIESFVLRRSKRLIFLHKNNLLNQHVFILFSFELTYIWRALSNCPEEALGEMLSECNVISSHELLPLKTLVEGAVFAHLKRTEIARQVLEECIARSDELKEEKHIAAFACYELGLMLIQDPKTRELGKEWLVQARDKYKNYDFENRLSMRVHAALRLADAYSANNNNTVTSSPSE